MPLATLSGKPASASDADQFWYLRQTDPTYKVLVSRFFAPKIVNYRLSDGGFAPGWRKLVYLPVKPGSGADAAGVVSGAYVLFNYFAPDRLKAPYLVASGDGHAISSNNQVILVRKSSAASMQGHYKDNVFFAVYSGYDPANPGNSYRLINALKAGFDIPADGAVKAYAVPDACAQCHGHDREQGRAVDANGNDLKGAKGGVYAFVKPNYLDTDQWYDAMRLDFNDILNAGVEPVFDGGSRIDTPQQYKKAMDVLFELNTLIAGQGHMAKRPQASQESDNFQFASTDKWLELHGSTTDRTRIFAPQERLFGATLPVAPSAPRPETAQLTDQLSQYCFRCHSSIKFNVFDYDHLVAKKSNSNLAGYIGLMPLGRSLASSEQACLRALLKSVPDQTGKASRDVVQKCGSGYLMKGVSAGGRGYCYVLQDPSFADGSEIMQADCGRPDYAEKIWVFDSPTGQFRSAARPDKCLAVAPNYIDRAARKISDVTFDGAEINYNYQPVIITRCSTPKPDVRLTWTMENRGGMSLIRSKDDPDLCLSGTDDYTTGKLTIAYAEGCSRRLSVQPNGSFFIRTYANTKDLALQ